MKTIFKKYSAYIVALIVISTLAFAGARYEIYRLSPAPKNGQIIGEKDGKWQATSAGSVFNEFYDAEAESYAYWGTAFNTTTQEYEWAAIDIKDYAYVLAAEGSGIGALNTDSRGRKGPFNLGDAYSANSNMILPKVFGDTTGITVDVCCAKDSVFYLVFSRADTLLRNSSAQAGYAWAYYVTGYVPEVD